MHRSAWAIASSARSHQPAKCTSLIGAMHPPTGTGTGILVFAKPPLKWAIAPHFSYESPAVHQCAPSPNSCTRPQRHSGQGKSHASKGRVCKTPLRRPTDRGIHRFPATRALILRWPCFRPPPDTGGVAHSGTGASGPREQAWARVIHALNHQNCNTIGSIIPTRSREELRHRTHPPKDRKPPDSALEMASIALCNAFHFSLQPTHCENGPGAIALCRFPLRAVPPNGSLLPIRRHVNPARSTPPGCARREGPLPGSAAALPSAGPPPPGITRPCRYHHSPRLCWTFTSQKGIPLRHSGTSPHPGLLAESAHLGGFPPVSGSKSPRLPKRELTQIPVHGYNVTSGPPNRPASRSSSLPHVSRHWPPPVRAASLPAPARRLRHG